MPILTPSEVKTIAAGNADILKEQNEKVILTPAEVKTIAAASPEILKAKSNETVKMMGSNTTLAESKVIDGVKHDLFKPVTDKDKAVIRRTDVDSGKTISLTQYPHFDHAEQVYDDQLKVAEKLAPKTEEKPKLAAFVEVAQKLENEPVEMKGNKDLKDYAGMNPEAAAVMGWPDKDHAIELDEHQSETVRTKNLVHETVEQEEMKQGETYHDAHLDALKAETTIKTPEHLAEKVQEIRERPAKKGNHPKIVKVHDDGDLTVKKGDTNYVVTTEGKTFKEVKPEPELKDVIQHSHELGEKATRGGQEVSRGPHKAEKAGSIPAPATKPTEPEPTREGHPISEAENRAIHAWYGEHGEITTEVRDIWVY